MLSETQVSRAKLAAKPYRLTDQHGLYLVVTPSGGKLWRWKYRYQGRERLASFGGFPAVSLARARQLHAEGRELLARGVDPKGLKSNATPATVLTFRAVAEQWLEFWASDKAPEHVATTRRRLEGDVYPAIGRLPLADIRPAALVKMAKTIESRGVSDLPKRALQTVGQIFRYAIAHDLAERNPAAEFKPGDVLKPARSRNMARVDAAALPALLRAIEDYPTEQTRLACKLMALTFVRTAELIGAEWSEFDLRAARWNIPGERMKMKTPHIVPLASQTLEILEALRVTSAGSRYVFPGDQSATTMSNNTILQALGRMGYKGVMTGHGFRGLASTLLHEQGWPHDHIELQLAHSARDGVSAAYNHALYLEPRATMMQAWADYLEQQRGTE